MTERITVELARANRGGRVLVEASGDDIDSALAAFDQAVEDHDQPLNGQLVVRAVLDLSAGSAMIEGDPARGYDDARGNFDDARAEYSDGPGWGGPG